MFQRKYATLASLNQKQKRLKPGMEMVQKLLILRHIVDDVQTYASLAKLRLKENKTYQEREKYVKDKLEFEAIARARYGNARLNFKKLVMKHYENPESLFVEKDDNVKQIFKTL
jgi:hypothetical protein